MPPLTSPNRVQRNATFSHKGFSVPDPFAPRQNPGHSFFSALLATALFRCWHIIILFSAWGTLISVLNHHGHKLTFQPTLLTVIGTVLGFVISYRTTSSFERYNEGRRLWSQIILASRTFARTTWFHVQGTRHISLSPYPAATEQESAQVLKARYMIEKKTVINLLEAYAVAIKHYLRGEDGIYYQDLYYLVKFLPAYALPAGVPSQPDLTGMGDSHSFTHPDSPEPKMSENGDRLASGGSFLNQRTSVSSTATQQLPLPVTTPVSRKPVFLEPWKKSSESGRGKVILPKDDETYLMPASMPPKYHLFDLFPFSLFIKCYTKRGREIKGKKAARLRAKMRNQAISHNLPLEISLYLSSYISALQARKAADVPTTNTLLLALNQLVDSLTGLERILTTPIPFSYSIHLWAVCILYNLCLPFQIWSALGWITIPASSLLSFIFFGFLVAGEEIENPFGYDKNDLNMDHFTSNIIRNELRAITSTAPPDPARWAFAQENDLLFAGNYANDERVTPEEWMKRGYGSMQVAASLM
ncbi:UPF0187-domain-containing protein [Hymenopellis radicata]|nr:UPF0187-domain-containing protein [Hymenopellis radicata]